MIKLNAFLARCSVIVVCVMALAWPVAADETDRRKAIDDLANDLADYDADDATTLGKIAALRAAIDKIEQRRPDAFLTSRAKQLTALIKADSTFLPATRTEIGKLRAAIAVFEQQRLNAFITTHVDLLAAVIKPESDLLAATTAKVKTLGETIRAYQAKSPLTALGLRMQDTTVLLKSAQDGRDPYSIAGTRAAVTALVSELDAFRKWREPSAYVVDLITRTTAMLDLPTVKVHLRDTAADRTKAKALANKLTATVEAGTLAARIQARSTELTALLPDAPTLLPGNKPLKEAIEGVLTAAKAALGGGRVIMITKARYGYLKDEKRTCRPTRVMQMACNGEPSCAYQANPCGYDPAPTAAPKDKGLHLHYRCIDLVTGTVVVRNHITLTGASQSVSCAAGKHPASDDAARRK